MLIRVFAFLVAVAVAAVSVASGATVSAQRSLVWGSGVRAVADTPARYLYIQAVDDTGRNFTESAGPNAFKVTATLTVPAGGARRLTTKLMDRGDGSYAVQYFFNMMAKEIVVVVETASGAAVRGSPFVLAGPLVHEGCDCPREPAEFVADYECTLSDPAGQIARDLAPFLARGGVTRADIDAGLAAGVANSSSLLHYTVINNTFYCRIYGPYGGFKKYVDEMLLSLRRRVRLPDMEFLLNMGDWPQAPRFKADGTAQAPLPIFSWCAAEDHYDMLLPTYKMSTATVFGKDLENIQEIDGKSFTEGAAWAQKREVLLFRGRPSNEMRIKAMLMAKDHPTLLDMKVTKNQFNYFPNDEARAEHKIFERTYGPKADLQPVMTFFKNKYILNIDGTVAAYRFGATLAGNSLNFKQESNYYEHFYKALQPWVHYVPVANDLSDVLEKVLWAKEHDAEAQAIVARARAFARTHLRVEDVYCYHLLAFEAFARASRFTPTVHPGQELVIDEAAKKCDCPVRRMLPGTDSTVPTAAAAGLGWSSLLLVSSAILVALLVAARFSTSFSSAASTNTKAGAGATPSASSGAKASNKKSKNN